MGTTTIFGRTNDLRARLERLSKKELKKIDALSAWTSERVRGWSALLELHNGNFHPLLWWHGKLLHLKDAQKLLVNKHYDKYTEKYSRSSEWTLVKKYLESELKALDKEYQRAKRRKR